MQINLLNDFIKAYENTYSVSFDDSFKGRIQELCKELNEPFMHASYALENELKELVFSLDKNVNIAIIGQFSSGKSSLLNLILGRDCLPTGVVPVTFKPTFLRYAKEYFLRVEFEDGSDIITNIEKLAFYTDQRNEVKQAKSLHIFAPIPLLEKITLVDTPGLNANENDTLTTLDELKNIHGAIWLSLIDNAGKKSEEDAIKANLELLGENSICVLNQKDKLSTEELDNVLNYAKSVFLKYFNELIAISCKEAKDEQSYEKSNFQSLLDFLTQLDTTVLKEKFVKRKILNLCEILDCDIDYLLGNIDVPRHITQDMMDLTGLSEGACEKLKYLQLKNCSTGNLDCLSLLIDDVDFSYFLSLISSLTDEDDNSMIATNSGNARINVRRSDLVKFAIQNSVIEITSRVRAKYLSKYETPEQRFDNFIHQKMYAFAEGLFAEGKLSEKAYLEIIKQYNEGNFEFSPLQKGGFDNG